MYAPICLFTYNRLFETKQTIEALQKNFLASESELIIFSDGPKNKDAEKKVEEVREYIHQVSGFNSVQVYESPTNKGLAKSIIEGVTKVLMDFNNVIVLEDDLLTSRNFLNYMNQALGYYERDSQIQTICGYSVFIKKLDEFEDVYFQKRPLSWGWATWSTRWSKDLFNKEIIRNEITQDKNILKKFKNEFGNDIADMLLDSLNNKNDSWYVRWAYNHFKKDTYSVYPSLSLVENIGHGELSTHCKGINSYDYRLDNGRRTNFKFIEFDSRIDKYSKHFLKYFTLKHKVVFRVKLIGSRNGRKELIAEIRMRAKKVLS